MPEGQHASTEAARNPQPAPAWLADSEAAKPAYIGDRMQAALTAVHLGDLTRRAILSQLAYRDGPGGARPSVPSIAQTLGMSNATVHRHLNALRKGGAVWWQQSRGASRYSLNWPLILSHPCEGLEDGNSRTGARVYEAETLANETLNPRKFDDKPSHSFARRTGSNREPEAIAAAAVRPQATGGGGGNRANMEPESEPEARSAAPPPFAGSRRGASQPEGEPERTARPARPRFTNTYSASGELHERFGHLGEGTDAWKRAVDEAGFARDRTPAEARQYEIERTRQLIEIWKDRDPKHADGLRRDLARREAAGRPEDARQEGRGASQTDDNRRKP